jgi:hypothetical protein
MSLINAISRRRLLSTDASLVGAGASFMIVSEVMPPLVASPMRRRPWLEEGIT